MRQLVLGALLVPALCIPAFAGCQFVDDPLIGPEWDCGGPVISRGVFAAPASAEVAPCGPGLPHGTEACNEAQPVAGRDGQPVSASDALGVAAAATAMGVAAMSGNAGAVAAAAMGVGAAAAGAVGDAASSGAVGDAAAASDGAGTGD